MVDHEAPDDVLRPMSRTELEALRDLYAKHIPQEVQFYFLLQNQLNWNTKLDSWSEADKRKLSVRAYIGFFKPSQDDGTTGTFVAISEDEDPNVYFHSLKETPEQLERYLVDTKRINWACRPVFSSISDQFTPMLENVLKRFNCRYQELSDCSYYLISKEEALQFQYEIPPNLVLKDLNTAYTDLMNERWPHRYPNSEKYIRLMIEFNRGLGLFNADNDDLAGWVLKNEFAGVGHLQIMPDYRRKGLGEILAKAMTKRIAQEDNGPVNAFIVDKNAASIRLFLKIGYQRIDGSNWVRADYQE
uniref:N-acetyltransferase domain-containing protein n=1 Tax=Culex tarsalis TaxID=7177 RepID=A0A1Q3FP93_CULTA